MQEWWENLCPLLRVLYCIAIPSTLVLVLQLVMAMIGGHSDAGIDASDTSGLDMDTDTMMADLDGNGIPDILESPDAGVHFTDGGNPADFGNLRFLTLQTIVTFLASFSWVSIIFVSSGMFVPLAVGIGVGCGLVMMLLVAKMVQMSRKLVENGAINLKNAIGETATVYVTVPPRNQGTGKITMQLQGRFGEFDAVSADNTTLGSGEQVLVTDVVGDTLVVEAAD
jgi:membrane protein implicated in regulation of membrane protease activity